MFAGLVTPELSLMSRTGASSEAIEALSDEEADQLASILDPGL